MAKFFWPAGAGHDFSEGPGSGCSPATGLVQLTPFSVMIVTRNSNE